MRFLLAFALVGGLALALGASRHAAPDAMAAVALGSYEPVECWSDAPVFAEYTALLTKD